MIGFIARQYRYMKNSINVVLALKAINAPSNNCFLLLT